MRTAVVLFTSDLRLHDHPPLRAALERSDTVVPLFVRDSGMPTPPPNRAAFLADCLRDLDTALRERGGRLIVRSGDVVGQVCKVVAETDADTVHLTGGVSAYAHRREERLRTALENAGCRLCVHDTVITAVPPGTLAPSAKDHFAVFTPYYRRWSGHPLRQVLGAPRSVPVPECVGSEPLPSRDAGSASPDLPAGGERAARERLTTWLRTGLAGYGDDRDTLPADATSRLSPHLHFGTLSPVEAVRRARDAGGPGADAFVRQLAWRDFHHQVLAARPDAAGSDYRTRHDRWRSPTTARDEIEAWREGRTGIPVVDAAMRQLRHEGWMHNRGRLLTASFLTKTLYVDWRVGARHFMELLVDGDLANNQLNWQWVAGTGTDTRPNRVLNPVRQGRRYDPDGAYVRRWVPELAGIGGPDAHEPWKLRDPGGSAPGYPEPIVGLSEAVTRFRRSRNLD